MLIYKFTNPFEPKVTQFTSKYMSLAFKLVLGFKLVQICISFTVNHEILCTSNQLAQYMIDFIASVLERDVSNPFFWYLVINAKCAHKVTNKTSKCHIAWNPFHKGVNFSIKKGSLYHWAGVSHIVHCLPSTTAAHQSPSTDHYRKYTQLIRDGIETKWILAVKRQKYNKSSKPLHTQLVNITLIDVFHYVDLHTSTNEENADPTKGSSHDNFKTIFLQNTKQYTKLC